VAAQLDLSWQLLGQFNMHVSSLDSMYTRCASVDTTPILGWHIVNYGGSRDTLFEKVSCTETNMLHL